MVEITGVYGPENGFDPGWQLPFVTWRGSKFLFIFNFQGRAEIHPLQETAFFL